MRGIFRFRMLCNGNKMKKTIPFLLALVVIALFGSGVLLLTGRYSCGEALLGGGCAAIVGVLGPIVAAWFEKILCRKH